MEKKPQKPIPSQISIYTDGSQTPQHVGSGLVIYELNKEICYKSLRLSDNTTVFQAEMIAIRAATQLMIEHLQEHQKYIKIFSDSQAAIQALNSPTITSKIVEETVRNLNTLGSKVNRLEIEWIKAHVGYEGNERADELARQAADIPEIDLHIADSWTNFKNTLWEETYKKWNLRWNGEDRFRQTKLCLLYTSDAADE